MSERTGGVAPDPASRPIGRDEVIEATAEAAADLFAERNPSQVSVREIAARAGVSHALVHRYMGSKDEIFAAALTYARSSAAEFWTHEHGMSKTAGTFADEHPPGRFVRMVVRASLDGMKISPEDMKLPHVDAMMQMLLSTPFPPEDAERGFDSRLLFSAVTALAAGMYVSGDFFLVQAGLEEANHEQVYSELNRLIRRILTLADKDAGQLV
jgi:TetR/AcrR family transcriptional regulator, repressor for neighboring sulfatase